MGARILPHQVEEMSKDCIRMKINSDPNMLFRELTGRDYGIDAIIELFENEMPTGKICFLQIKATQNAILPLIKNHDYISCPNISESNLNYSFQRNILVVLIYISLKGEKGFYYKVLNGEVNATKIRKKNTIRIPIENYILNDVTLLSNVIREFYM